MKDKMVFAAVYVFLIILGILAVGMAAQKTPGPDFGPYANTPGIEKAWQECMCRGGEWGIYHHYTDRGYGEAPEPRCNLPASDAGEECNSRWGCQGVCVVDYTPEQRAMLKKGIEFEAVGTCSPGKLYDGKIADIDGGIVRGEDGYDQQTVLLANILKGLELYGEIAGKN